MSLFSEAQVPSFDPTRPPPYSDSVLQPPATAIAIHCPPSTCHPGCALFCTLVPNPHGLLSYLSSYVWLALYGCWHPPLPSPPSFLPIIHFYVDTEMDGVACTSKNEIRLSAKYLSNYHGMYLLQEIQGVLLHEMVHVWQFNQNAPGGLIEGIADYFRLHAGLAPPHWKLPTRSSMDGKRWDQGYEFTAFFLTWLQYQYPHVDHLISLLNWQLCQTFTCAEDFFQALLGESLINLWKRYQSAFD